jgi:hypothetical protein
MYAKLCGEHYRAGHNPALTAKYEKLMQEARQAHVSITDDVAHAADFTALTAAITLSRIIDMLAACKGPQARAERILEMLAEQSNSIGGFLYVMREDGPVYTAQIGNPTLLPDMDALVRERVQAEIDSNSDVTTSDVGMNTADARTMDWTGQRGEKYRSVLLGHYVKEGFVITGLAVMLLDPSKPFDYPSEVISAMSESLLDAGDTKLSCAFLNASEKPSK